MGDKMLIPLDGSELAEAALDYAERLSATLGWSTVLLQVVHPESAHHGHGGRPLLEGSLAQLENEEDSGAATYERIREQEAAAMEQLARPEARLKAAGVQVVREVGVGDPAEVIAERAGDDDIALVVLASHGRTGLARLFRGSVADALVKRTSCPTLVVRPFKDEARRVDLEHAERLAPNEADAVRQVMGAAAG